MLHVHLPTVSLGTYFQSNSYDKQQKSIFRLYPSLWIELTLMNQALMGHVYIYWFSPIRDLLFLPFVMVSLACSITWFNFFSFSGSVCSWQGWIVSAYTQREANAWTWRNFRLWLRQMAEKLPGTCHCYVLIVSFVHQFYTCVILKNKIIKCNGAPLYIHVHVASCDSFSQGSSPTKGFSLIDYLISLVHKRQICAHFCLEFACRIGWRNFLEMCINVQLWCTTDSRTVIQDLS